MPSLFAQPLPLCRPQWGGGVHCTKYYWHSWIHRYARKYIILVLTWYRDETSPTSLVAEIMKGPVAAWSAVCKGVCVPCRAEWSLLISPHLPCG